MLRRCRLWAFAAVLLLVSGISSTSLWARTHDVDFYFVDAADQEWYTLSCICDVDVDTHPFWHDWTFGSEPNDETYYSAQTRSTSAPQQCTETVRDVMVAEYVAADIDFKPFCASFVTSNPVTSVYSFGNSSTSGTWAWGSHHSSPSSGSHGAIAIVLPVMLTNVNCVYTASGASPALNSGYRDAFRQQEIRSSTGSRHMYGDAADLATPSKEENSDPGYSQWSTMKTAAWSGCSAVACVEPRAISPSHVHVDYRGADKCPSGWGPG